VIRSQVKLFEQFGKVTEQVERLAVEGLNAAAREAAQVAQTHASFDLELEVIPAHDDVDGYSAGIKSRKQGRSSAVLIAGFFDKGTLGKRTAKLGARSRRKESWEVKRDTGGYTAKRHEITAEMGVEAQHFFGKARAAGRRAMLARIRRSP
jgi:hypothetical protein